MTVGLGDPESKPPFLRQVRAYRSVWWYYAALAIDPVLRFNWVIYVIFKDDTQHSTIVSFFISFAEVLRRGLWILFRVENEHCTNITRSRASRDVPLPYKMPTPRHDDTFPHPATRLDEESGDAAARTTARDDSTPVSRAFRRVGTAHAEDYQRNKHPKQSDSDDSDVDEHESPQAREHPE
jgi:xenotropic and polytropic retrovirus receptor 1